MSFVEVFPIDPVIATTRAELCSRTARPRRASAANASSGTSVATAPLATASSTKVRAVADGDEQVARNDAPRIDLHAGEAVRAYLCMPQALEQGGLERDHAGALSAPQRVACDLAVVEGELAACDLLPLLVTLAGDHDDVARPRRLERPLDRTAPVELDVELETRPTTSDAIAAGILAARIVGRDERDVGELGDDLTHQRPLRAVAVAARAEDADDAAAVELARRPRALSRARPACVRSRRGR